MTKKDTDDGKTSEAQTKTQAKVKDETKFGERIDALEAAWKLNDGITTMLDARATALEERMLERDELHGAILEKCHELETRLNAGEATGDDADEASNTGERLTKMINAISKLSQDMQKYGAAFRKLEIKVNEKDTLHGSIDGLGKIDDLK